MAFQPPSLTEPGVRSPTFIAEEDSCFGQARRRKGRKAKTASRFMAADCIARTWVGLSSPTSCDYPLVTVILVPGQPVGLESPTHVRAVCDTSFPRWEGGATAWTTSIAKAMV